jgi:hypothetical protein
MKTKIYRFNVTEGKHKGHHVNTDAWGIEFEGRNPETAGWCLDCHEPVDVYEVEPNKVAEEL